MNTKKKDIKVYYVREGAFQSVISDTYSFAVLLLTLLFNARYLDNSWIIQVFICFFFFLFIHGRGSKRIKRYNSRQELVDDLKTELESEGYKGYLTKE